MICSVDNCSSEATHTFVWPWGTPGACCRNHLVVVQQRSRATRGRHGVVNFSALDPDRPVEITRDERVELHSARLVAESEREDARVRAAKLLDANTALSTERNGLRARCSQLEAQVKELTARVGVVIGERDNALVTVDELRQQIERLDVGDDARTRDTPPEGLVRVE